MQLLAVLIATVSAAAGLIGRRRVSLRVGRAMLTLGVASGLGVVALLAGMLTSVASFSFWNVALLTLALACIGLMLAPFGAVVVLSHRTWSSRRERER